MGRLESGHEFHSVFENTQKLSSLQCPLLTRQGGLFRVFFQHKGLGEYQAIVAGNALYRVFNSLSVCQTNGFLRTFQNGARIEPGFSLSDADPSPN
jgi:hypothetical protein